MGESLVFERDTTALEGHPAVLAWSGLDPTSRRPQSVDVLMTSVGVNWRKSGLFRLNGAGPDGGAVIAKAAPTNRLTVERSIYEEILPRLSVSNLSYYGFWEDAVNELSWLFVEDAGDVPYQPHLPEHYQLGVEWIATMHTETFRLQPRGLPEKSLDGHLAELRDVREMINRSFDDPSCSRDDDEMLRTILRECDELELRWESIEDFCAELPRCLVHGDFTGKNIRVGGRGLYVFDWETAGWGVPAVDVGHMDAEGYRARVKATWPELDLETIRRLVQVGDILMSIGFLEAFSKGLGTDWALPALWNLEFYGVKLAAARRAAGLELPMESTAARRDDLFEPVVRAWQAVSRKSSDPLAVEELAGGPRSETALYRIRGRDRQGSVIAKRSSRAKMEYEAGLYGTVESLGVSAIHCYGFVGDPNPDWGWLFLQEIGGQAYSARDPEQRRLISEWLGAFHGISSLRDLAGVVEGRGTGHYLESLRMGRTRIIDNISNPALDKDARALLQKVVEHCSALESNWSQMETILDGGPQCLVHGDFVPKNIRLLTGASDHGVYVMDWETGGWGTPAHDIGEADVDAYWKAVAPYWPTVDRSDIQAYWDVGWILREIPSIEWASLGLESEWVDTVMVEFEVYEERLAKGLTKAGWA